MVKSLSIFAKSAIALIIAFIAFRLASLGAYPLYDTTEARYGEIARIMLETRDWITPQFDYNIPFWGKPPLYAWLSVISFTVFGVSEFSARLPHFLCGLLTLALVFQLTNKALGKEKAIAACLVLISSIGFVIATGMVMTDAVLTLSITLAMSSYWQAFKYGEKAFYGNLFFIALAIGMLAKGPVAVVIVGIPLVIWIIWQKCFIQALKALPWLSGITLFLAFSLPWYILAEMKTPGFLEYFLWGEHIQRFLVSGWQGDLYGSAHKEAKGTIWLFWLAMAFPWSFILTHKAYQYLFSKKENTTGKTNINSYLLIWMISPMLLFTLAGNILAAYVLPGFAAMAILCANNIKLGKKMLVSAWLSLVIVAIALFAVSNSYTSKTAESALLGDNLTRYQNSALYYWQKRPFSAQFYSKGQAQLLNDKTKLQDMLKIEKKFYLAIKHQDFAELKPQLETLCDITQQTKKRLLLRCLAK
ncbi:glycosyltransferase family 39 protein [Pseudoalteromonas sp. C2R02]|uniref:ArnT family glycosyltransferase n=1 Tax=Pseudoalteromonas sp. C2R02 TaxID=2841565 RepID=UPI001C094FEA|nr:glycosyltransferase family 39 protein [Pseudoalteromonas sp. C2R02]MBU2972459.1 glycosyltransferase family 39 protein [Pseudoalteromonas sp. C2R02]